MDVFDRDVVLFASEDCEEGLVVECAVTADGGLAILQRSDGPLTEWCYEESPHRLEVAVGPDAVRGLMAYFHLDDVGQLPAVLRACYTGYDCCQKIRQLMRRLDVPYEVVEGRIVR